MDLKRGPSKESEQKVSLTVISALASAVLEWILIFMILLDAVFSFFITRFAHYCQLQIPCLFCSRLDHVLGKERNNFYWDLVCHNHKSKLSSLISCQHPNYLFVHEICETCLLSLSSINKLNSPGSSASRKCAYCNEQWISKTHTDNLENIKSIHLKRTDIDAQSSVHAHVEYEQIKVTSNAESEDSLNNENANVVSREIGISGQDPMVRDGSQQRQMINLADSPASEKSIHPAPPVASLLSGKVGPTNPQHFVDSEIPLRNAFEEIKWPEDAPNAKKFEKDFRVGSGSIAANEIQIDPKHNKIDSSSLDLCDAYKLALGTRSRQLSGRFLEQQKSINESTKASEDLKLLLSQISAARGFELAEVSPRVSANSEDFKAIDSSAVMGMQIFHRRISLERNESNLSLDGSTISEIDGESMLDRLQRRAEHDKKIKESLYKELEEERNASAIAANQAMAMITRLQDEKSALNMEALQCLRMMEEQAEYDDGALRKANDLLLQKDKQIRDLEFELDLYRSQFGDITEA